MTLWEFICEVNSIISLSAIELDRITAAISKARRSTTSRAGKSMRLMWKPRSFANTALSIS
jgi:hypothetical protein